MTHPAQTPEGTTTAPDQGSSVVGARGQSVPEGWKLVPIEPTPEMIRQGRPENSIHGLALAEATYHAMLAAAPVPPAPSVEPVAWMWQHGETGMTGFVQHAPDDELRQWERMNRPRKIVAPLYASPTPAQADALDAARLLADLVNAKRWRDAAIKRMEADDDGEYERADAALDAAWEVAMRKGD